MKNVILFVIVSALSGCYGAQIDQLKRQNAQLAEQNKRLRQANADGYRPPGAPSLPSERPVPPAVGSPMMGMGQGATGAMWARQPHGVYMGTVGGAPRQVTQGRKLKLHNQVCDGGSRTMWDCGDADENGSPDYNTWLAFRIDGNPVVCDAGFVHPDTGESLLPPGQTCFVELGASRTVDLTIKAYRNSGNAAYVMLDASPRTAYKKVSVGDRNVAYYGIDETRFN